MRLKAAPVGLFQGGDPRRAEASNTIHRRFRRQRPGPASLCSEPVRQRPCVHLDSRPPAAAADLPHPPAVRSLPALWRAIPPASVFHSADRPEAGVDW